MSSFALDQIRRGPVKSYDRPAPVSPFNDRLLNILRRRLKIPWTFTAQELFPRSLDEPLTRSVLPWSLFLCHCLRFEIHSKITESPCLNIPCTPLIFIFVLLRCNSTNTTSNTAFAPIVWMIGWHSVSHARQSVGCYLMRLHAGWMHPNSPKWPQVTIILGMVLWGSHTG